MPKLSRNEFAYNAKVYEKKCQQCGTTFFTNRPIAIYCSALCRTHAFLDKEIKKNDKKIKRLEKKTKLPELKKEIKIPCKVYVTDGEWTNIYSQTGLRISSYCKNIKVGEKIEFNCNNKKYIVTRLKSRGNNTYRIEQY